MKSFNQANLALSKTKQEPVYFYSGVITRINDDSFIIDDEIVVKQADSMPIELNLGDVVNYTESAHGLFIVSLLIGAPRDKLVLRYNFADRLTIASKNIEIVASETVTVRSLNEITLETCRSIKVNCKNWLQSASDSVVNITSTWLQKCQHGSVESKELFRCDAGSQIITAKEDLRLDAKRINMG